MRVSDLLKCRRCDGAGTVRWFRESPRLRRCPNCRGAGSVGAAMLTVEARTAAGRAVSASTCTMREMVTDNLHDSEVAPVVAALEVGGQVRFGGGAAPMFTVTRVS